MADEQGVEVGLVVFLQHIEVLRDDEGGPEPAGRHHQVAGIRARARQGRPVYAGVAGLLEIIQRIGLVGPLDRTVDPVGNARLMAPVPAGLPAVLFEIVGDRGQRIGHRFPDVAPPVAIEIDRIYEIFRRQELRLAERPGNRAFHLGQGDMVTLQDLQRGDQLGIEQVAAAARIGLGRQRPDRRFRDRGASESRFPAPDRHDDLLRYAVALLDLVEHGGPLLHLRAADRNQRRDVVFRQIAPRRGEFRLPVHLRRLPRLAEIGQLPVWRYAG